MTPTQAVTASPSAAPARVLLSQSESGNWNSPPFTVSVSSLQLKVTYSYPGNGDSSGPGEFTAGIQPASDNQNIAARPPTRAAPRR